MTAYAAAFNSTHPAVTFVGAGAMAQVLAARMQERGYPVLAVINRSRGPAEALAQTVDARVHSEKLHHMPSETRLVACCVPDGALPDVALRLSRVSHAWEKTVVFHTSGALPAGVLQPLVEEGARTFSFHPLQALTAESTASVLDGVYAGVEGAPQAVAVGIELAVNLGMRYLVLSAEDKPRYHLAASMASNFLVTLQALVQSVMLSLDIDRATAQEVMAPLVRGTLDNLSTSTPEDALTGPIARGDLGTVHQHGLALRQHFPHLVPVYAALALETVTLAVRSSHLGAEQAEEMVALLDKLVTTPIPAPFAE
ncbi:MAG: Rossmann-like and DUF2520 domain-containing protein [Bacteroidota bacterium]